MERIIALLAAAVAASAGSTFSVTQDVGILRAGGTARFATKALKKGDPAPPVRWTIVPNVPGAGVSDTNDQTFLSLVAPAPGPEAVKQCVQAEVTATAPSGEAHTVYLTLVPAGQLSIQEACPGATVVISVLGLEQAGAVAAINGQRFFLDFFQSHPLPLERSASGPKADLYGPPWRWWEDIRIASVPEQVTAPIAQAARQFVQQWASLPVNALAQSGEFRVGLERRVAGFASPFTSAQGSLYERTSLGAFVYFGAQASLSSPAVVAQVFTIPAPGTAQRTAFDQAFPVSQYPQLTQASYIGFVPPSRDRAFQEYAAGFRLTTRFFYPSGAILPAPAMLSASFGQNQMITAGDRRGIVGAFEAFYPLPLAIKSKEMGAIYVFGRATLRLGGSARLATPPALAPAAGPVTDSAVAVIALPSDRDTYSIGVGIDAVQLMKRLVSVGR